MQRLPFQRLVHLVRFTLNEEERRQLDQITEAMENEFTVSDSLQEEMLRILLKRFIIQCTRIARQRLDITRERNPASRLSANTTT